MKFSISNPSSYHGPAQCAHPRSNSKRLVISLLSAPSHKIDVILCSMEEVKYCSPTKTLANSPVVVNDDLTLHHKPYIRSRPRYTADGESETPSVIR